MPTKERLTAAAAAAVAAAVEETYMHISNWRSNTQKCIHTERDSAACVCNVHDPRRCCYCCCKHFSMLILCMLSLLLLLLGLFLSGHIGKRWVSEWMCMRMCVWVCVWHQKRNAAFLCTECGHKSQCTVQYHKIHARKTTATTTTVSNQHITHQHNNSQQSPAQLKSNSMNTLRQGHTLLL